MLKDLDSAETDNAPFPPRCEQVSAATDTTSRSYASVAAASTAKESWRIASSAAEQLQPHLPRSLPLLVLPLLMCQDSPSNLNN